MVQCFKLKQTTVKLVEILFQHHIGCWIFIDRLMLFFRTNLIFIVPCTISNVEDFKSVGKCLVIHIEFLCAVSFQESQLFILTYFTPQDHITTIPLPGPFNKIFHPFPLLFPKHQCHYFTLCEHGQKLRFRLWILIILVFILVVCLTRIYSYLCLRGELSDSNRN